MCSSWVFVVQSTIVTASIVRGSAPRPTMTSLVRARSSARAAPAPTRARTTARASSDFIGGSRIQPVGSVELVECEPEARHEGLQEIADLRAVDPLDGRPQG